ncbi:hypothetical protein BV20DRAFT_964074 [Pilatotrama ljubarskyi]|nr:hypothetical protein BV20DRAFT_964074 [Pilatotrama ljubarskyi]
MRQMDQASGEALWLVRADEKAKGKTAKSPFTSCRSPTPPRSVRRIHLDPARSGQNIC